MRVAVCGGGVIGACVAYYLSLGGADVFIIERDRIAGGASGKSGGFLALDWCDGSALDQLARRSFSLHAELAEAFGNPWGYRCLDTYGGIVSASELWTDQRSVGDSARLDKRIALYRQLGTVVTTAQVTPDAFTRGMVDQAIKHGASVQIGDVTGLVLPRDGDRVAGVEIRGRVYEADAVVIAMGPWSARAQRWMPMRDVLGLKGHSILLKPTTPVPAEALFLELESNDGACDTLEVFPRPDGTVYICGLSANVPLPDDPRAVRTDAESTSCLRTLARTLSPFLRNADVLAAHACYRPVIRDGLPLMGAVRPIDGAFVATGHSVWGMLNAPASGEAMAGLILEGQSKTVDLTPFDPGRAV